MSSSIFKDLAAIREHQEREDRLIDEMFAREQERIERERPWSPAEIIWQSEWHQGFGEEAQEFIGFDNGKYYCAFTRSPAEDEEYLSWDGPYDSREAAKEALNQRVERWEEIRGEIEDEYQERQIEAFEHKRRAEELRRDPTVDQSRVGDILRIESAIRLDRERVQSLGIELQQELGGPER